MENRLLNDKNEYPSDEVLAKHLGKTKAIWDSFIARFATEHPDASLEWHYYNDGKSWLGKLVRKKKTICWISIWDRYFKTTFYFTAKNDQDIELLSIVQMLKDTYRECTPSGKLKPLTVEIKAQKTLKDVFTLIEYKSGLK